MLWISRSLENHESGARGPVAKILDVRLFRTNLWYEMVSNAGHSCMGEHELRWLDGVLGIYRLISASYTSDTTLLVL